MNIEHLLKLVRQGDEKAISYLYETYHKRMIVICQRIVGDSGLAEELANDSFLLSLSKLDTLHDDNRFDSWLKSITTNMALLYKRRHHEVPILSLSTVNENSIQSNEFVDEEDNLPEMVELISAIEALPSGYGKVFKMAVLKEMSHKEIANILGISSHSSSSQLFRARKSLQKSFSRYWPLMILILLIPITYYIFNLEDELIEHRTIVIEPKQSIAVEQSNNEIVNTEIIQLADVLSQPECSIENNSITVDSSVNISITEHNDSITTLVENNLQENHINNDALIVDNLPDSKGNVKKNYNKWSLNISFVEGFGGYKSINSFSFNGTIIPVVPVGNEPQPKQNPDGTIVSFNKWSQYIPFINTYEDVSVRGAIEKIAKNNAKNPSTNNIERNSHHYMPLTWSLALRYRLSNSIGIETGLNYSLLRSEFEIGSSMNCIRNQQTIHYLGIPLKGTYSIFANNKWNLYGSLGLTFDIPLYAPLKTSYIIDGVSELENKTTQKAPLQWSIGAGVGLQYNFTPNFGLFIEPSLQYYIPTGSSIETYRTEHPFMFSLPLGLRITW